MADWTGLEPATPGVTGRYSNQLNYRSSVDASHFSWRSAMSPALQKVVGGDGIEPPTLCL